MRIVVALILLQTLFFKFTAAPESVYIFERVGLEPYGRITSGLFECIAAILILLPRTVWIGAGLSLGIISGALFFHLTVLGIEVQGDGGLLFSLALIVFVFSAVIVWFEREELSRLIRLINK